jgi:hypothetical protein
MRHLSFVAAWFGNDWGQVEPGGPLALKNQGPPALFDGDWHSGVAVFLRERFCVRMGSLWGCKPSNLDEKVERIPWKYGLILMELGKQLVECLSS